MASISEVGADPWRATLHQVPMRGVISTHPRGHPSTQRPQSIALLAMERENPVYQAAGSEMTDVDAFSAIVAGIDVRPLDEGSLSHRSSRFRK